MDRLSIVIPSRNEIFLQKTILEVLSKATGDIEIIPVLDGYEPPVEEIVTDPRVTYLRLPKAGFTQKRHGINKAISMSTGKYVMSLDAHCMVANGFDEQLIKDHQDNWVQIPRRNRLDAENWCLQPQADKRPPIDYEYIMFNPLIKDKGIHGFKWDARTNERVNIPIDETQTFQGSCWFMTKNYFNYLGLMQIEGYTGWGQEAESIWLKVRKDGGKIITNKNTSYAHLHKGDKYGRMYHMSKAENRRSYDYSYNLTVIQNKDLFIKTIEQFWPLPAWPGDWKKRLYA